MNRLGVVLALVTIVGVVGFGGLAPLVEDLPDSETGPTDPERPDDAPDESVEVSVGANEGTAAERGAGNLSGVNGSGGGGGVIGDPEFPEVLNWLLLLALALLLFNILYGSSRGDKGSESGSRSTAAYLVLAILLLSAIVLGGWVPGLGPPGAASAESATSSDPVLTPSLLVAVLVGNLLLVGVGILAGARRRATPDEPAEDPMATRAVGTAAGRAAAEVGDDDLSNVVYRAWHEMTSALAIPDADSATPAEFASEAVDAGMARDDVDALTTLFREVRYGDRPVTEGRERRARGVLRRIETRYARTQRGGEDPGAGDESLAGDGPAAAADSTGGDDPGAAEDWGSGDR